MEVGVLTDNDINNYKRAIADIKTPEGKRDAIFYTLMSNIAGKVSTTLTSNSNSGFDVSKYAYDYDKLVSELARKIPKDIKDKTSFPSTAKSLNPMFYDSIDDMQKNLDTTGAWQGYFDTVIAPYAKDNRITYEEAFDDMKEAKRQEKLMKGITFNQVGSDTNKAVISKLSTKQDGAKGGQCGRFVNQITGLGVGDSYQSKMSKMDPTITKPEPGMVFTMPYKDTGHIGFIVGIDGDQAIVKDSNYSLDEKIKTHKIALSKITGLARV